MNLEEKIVDIILTNELESRFILGVDGLSRSGKTTLVKKVSDILQEKGIHFYVFHIDNHIVEREKRYNTGNEEWIEYYDLQWDVDWLTDNLFKKLKVSEAFNLSFYDQISDSHITKNIELPSNCIILIEGVFLQRSEWRRFFDYVIYLDYPRNKRFLRESELTQKGIGKF